MGPAAPLPGRILENILLGYYTQVVAVVVTNIVADPDPVESGLFGSPESVSEKIPDPDPLSTKRPHVIQIFSL